MPKDPLSPKPIPPPGYEIQNLPDFLKPANAGTKTVRGESYVLPGLGQVVAEVSQNNPHTIEVREPRDFTQPIQTHESTHVFQLSRNQPFVNKTFNSAPLPTTAAGYSYGGLPGLEQALQKHKTIADFNVEQQADMVADYQKETQNAIRWKDAESLARIIAAYHPFVSQLAKIPPKGANMTQMTQQDLTPAAPMPPVNVAGMPLLPDKLIGGATAPARTQTASTNTPNPHPIPSNSPDIKAVGTKFPALSPYLNNLVVQPGVNTKKDDRQVEFYPPWESTNPNKGKLTITPYRKELTSGQGLTNTVAGELLHHIGGVDPTSGKPINPAYYSLKQAVAAARTPGQIALDQRIYQQQVKRGEKRPFNQWFNQSRLDEYIMGYVTPDKTDEWRKNGFYNSPDMKKAVDAVKQYLTTPVPQKTVQELKSQALRLNPVAGGHKIGEVKKFANGKTGVWDGHGWEAK